MARVTTYVLEETTYVLEDGTKVEFETEPVEGWREVGFDEVVGRIGDAVEPLVAGAAAIASCLDALRLNEIEVKFGVKVSGTANWVIAKPLERDRGLS